MSTSYCSPQTHFSYVSWHPCAFATADHYILPGIFSPLPSVTTHFHGFPLPSISGLCTTVFSDPLLLFIP